MNGYVNNGETNVSPIFFYAKIYPLEFVEFER